MIDDALNEVSESTRECASPPPASDARAPRLVLTGGGTGGHVSPAIAVLEELRSRGPVEAFWIGSPTGIERRTAREQGVPYYPVRVGKLRRYASLSTLADSVRVPIGIFQAWRILRELRPQAVFSTGGFVGVPAVIAAWKMGIPALTHEQTAYPGLATRINARFCDIVALTFPETVASFERAKHRVIVTGNPVRSMVVRGDAAAAHARFGLKSDLPLVYVTGGIQGAQAVNAVISDALPQLLRLANVIHQCGPNEANGDLERLMQRAAQLPAELQHRYRAVEVVRAEIGDIYAAASLVVGRAGAGTVAELSAVGLPSILIPLPGAVEQRRNSEHLVDAEAAVLLPQDQLTPEALLDRVRELLGNTERMSKMRQAALASAPRDAAQRVADALLELVDRNATCSGQRQSPRTPTTRA